MVKLFDSASSSYLWEVTSDTNFPRCVKSDHHAHV